MDAEALPCWCPCQRGFVSCSLKLDRRAFVPGEDISVAVDIQNASRKEIASSFVAMTQVTPITSEYFNRTFPGPNYQQCGLRAELYHILIYGFRGAIDKY